MAIMATTTLYNRLLKKLVATAAFGALTATSQAGLFCDWHTEHDRPYCSPACEQGWGYHDTCWRRFPATEPCTDWGAHCAADSVQYGSTVPAGVPYTGVPLVPGFQQPLNGQSFPIQDGGVVLGAPQSNYNSYNVNPSPIPPAGQVNQQPDGTRSFAPADHGGQKPMTEEMPSGGGNEQGSDQLQLPGLGEDVKLPPIPDVSRATPYLNQGYINQSYQNQFQTVAQSNVVGSNEPLSLYPADKAISVYPRNEIVTQPQYGQPQLGQPQYPQYGQPQQTFVQPMGQQQMMVPGLSQQGNQYQVPNQGAYQQQYQPTAIQVAPGRQPSVTGVSYSRSIRPVSNNVNVQQAVPAQKQSLLSKINPFSR